MSLPGPVYDPVYLFILAVSSGVTVIPVTHMLSQEELRITGQVLELILEVIKSGGQCFRFAIANVQCLQALNPTWQNTRRQIRGGWWSQDGFLLKKLRVGTGRIVGIRSRLPSTLSSPSSPRTCLNSFTVLPTSILFFWLH